MDKWTHLNRVNGIVTIRLTSWKYFGDFINQELLSSTEYIFRGQKDKSWKLQPTFDRIVSIHSSDYATRKSEHLVKFKYYSRGRLKLEHRSQLLNDNDWWAIGQHNGLTTPLLDWTDSPFIAAYFAFEEENKKIPTERIIYAIATDYIKEYSENKIELFYSHNDENPRLINQRGLFTIAKDKIDIETHIKKRFVDGKNKIALIKIIVPEKKVNDRVEFLKFLNRMNINHLTLFPDLTGTGNYCNKSLTIDKY